MTEERFPEFIVALPVKPAEKLAMIGGTNGMVFAINNPHYPLRSWYLDPKEMAGDTSHIVKVIKEQDIEIDEVVEMLTRVYDKVLEADLHPKLYCRSSNITCRYATIVQKGIEEARQKRLLTREEVDQLKEISKGSKSSSIRVIKEMLGCQPLRAYLKSNMIDNNRLIIQVLEDPFLNCRTKLGILEVYERFANAIDDPKSLKKWH